MTLQSTSTPFLPACLSVLTEKEIDMSPDSVSRRRAARMPSCFAAQEATHPRVYDSTKVICSVSNVRQCEEYETNYNYLLMSRTENLIRIFSAKWSANRLQRLARHAPSRVVTLAAPNSKQRKHNCKPWGIHAIVFMRRFHLQ